MRQISGPGGQADHAPGGKTADHGRQFQCMETDRWLQQWSGKGSRRIDTRSRPGCRFTSPIVHAATETTEHGRVIVRLIGGRCWCRRGCRCYSWVREFPRVTWKYLERMILLQASFDLASPECGDAHGAAGRTRTLPRLSRPTPRARRPL